MNERKRITEVGGQANPAVGLKKPENPFITKLSMVKFRGPTAATVTEALWGDGKQPPWLRKAK